MATQDYKRAYIWQLPVRLFHWVNALAITVLIGTGFLISNPPAIMSKAEASNQFWFGYIREIHFMSAYLMFAVIFIRIYWAFRGNKYSDWKVFFPLNKKGFAGMWHTIKHDIFLQNEKVYDYKTSVHVGHNNVAAFSYLVMFLMAIVMIFTGFGLYSANATWFLPKMFAWVPEFFGGDATIRMVHHFTMWGFILFIVIHVYLVFYHDWLEGRGESSAMISGYKFVRSERTKIATEKKPSTESTKESVK